MTEAQNEEIAHALDAVYESINTGENIRAIISAGDGSSWVSVTQDRLALSWPFSYEAVDGFIADVGRWIQPIDMEECVPGEKLELSFGLPKMKILVAVVDQIFSKVLKLGDGYEIDTRFEAAG